MQQAQVTPVKVRAFDSALDVDVLRVVGYRGRCPCEWSTPVRESYDEARRETLKHKREAHGHRSR